MYSFQLPDVGEGVHEAQVVRWLVQDKEVIEEDQPIVEVQTDKAVVELPSPKKGIIHVGKWRVGAVVPVGEVLFRVEEESRIEEKEASLHSNRTKVLSAPSVRRLAKEMGIDLHRVSGSGKDGRVLKEDLNLYLKKASPMRNGSPQVKESEPILTKTDITQQALSPIRRRIGERLLYSVTHKPHATHFDELNVDGIVAWKRKTGKVTYTAILLKVVAMALKSHPLLNAHFDEELQKVSVYPTISMGIATDTEMGLLVPVVHEVEKKCVKELAAELTSLIQITRSGKCPPNKMKGSTLTMSNAGALGGKWASPIINPPEVAILALHPIEERPIVQDGKLTTGWRMNVSLAFDHRVLDGADAIRFTQTLQMYTKDPMVLLEEMV